MDKKIGETVTVIVPQSPPVLHTYSKNNPYLLRLTNHIPGFEPVTRIYTTHGFCELILSAKAMTDRTDAKDRTEPKTGSKQFKAYKKGFFLTYSQCPLDKADVGDHLLSLGPEIVVVSQEHHKSGDLHLHAWVEWNSPKSIYGCDFFDYKGYHCSIGHTQNPKMNTRGNALRYICKEDPEPWSFGLDTQAFLEAKKKHRSVIGEMIILGKKTVREVVKEYPQEIYNLDKLLKNANLYKVLSAEIPQYIPRRNFWIVGRPGVGKSYMIREYSITKCFVKSINKWWDGYSAEKMVLLDDFGPEHKMLSYYMKIWGDNYAFNAEIKGGTIVPSYDQLIVTSNYFPEEIWTGKEDRILVEAINRRFTILTLYHREDQEKMIAQIDGYELLESKRYLAVYNY